MERFTLAWDESINDFDFPENSFNLKHFTDLLLNHASKFKKEDVDYEKHFGYIEKFDLDSSENPQIFVRADLHGDLKSLIENLRSLQNEGLLDVNFKCNPGVHLVFLGDYCDRGCYGTEILELLMRLREENPQQVHLIRGNHEDATINFYYGENDRNLMKVVSHSKVALKQLYETMSLTSYFGIAIGEQIKYIHCTHGLFEPTTDPAPLLDHLNSRAHLPVPKKREFSERILKIASDSSSQLREAAQKIIELVKESNYFEQKETAYNWADVSKYTVSNLNTLRDRTFYLSVEDIQRYLKLSSANRSVEIVIRGHQHKFMHHKLGDDVLVTTLPTGMNCPAFQGIDQCDRAYIIDLKDWKKRAILREKGHAQTDQITASVPLTSAEV